MAETSIEWTDRTWNCLVGCSIASSGCTNCYAQRMAHRLGANPKTAATYAGLTRSTEKGPRWTGKVRLVPEKLDEPLRWRKPTRVFVNSMSDLFHPDVPFEFIAAVFGVMAACPQHTFQVLTKRPERAREFFSYQFGGLEDVATTVAREAMERFGIIWDARGGNRWAYPMPPLRLHLRRPWAWPLPNVWLGVSVEDQATADERIPLLLECPAAVRWVSAEPLLGPIDFSRVGLRRTDSGIGMQSWEKYDALNGSRFTQTWGGPWIWNGLRGPRINWVVVGGESGPGARSCYVAWIRSIVAQCRSARGPVFVKQLGACASDPENGLAGSRLQVPAEAAPLVSQRLRDRKGGDMAEFPEDLRVRQWPEVRRG